MLLENGENADLGRLGWPPVPLVAKIPTESVGGPHAGKRCYCMITWDLRGFVAKVWWAGVFGDQSFVCQDKWETELKLKISPQLWASEAVSTLCGFMRNSKSVFTPLLLARDNSVLGKCFQNIDKIAIFSFAKKCSKPFMLEENSHWN